VFFILLDREEAGVVFPSFIVFRQTRR